jgi:transposase InsO family protein
LAGAIEEIHAEVKGRYGSPRMTAELNARGHQCPGYTVAGLKIAHEIKAPAPRRLVRTTDSNHRPPVAPNIPDRDFDPDGADRFWCAEITSVATGGGWPYLAVVEALFSRTVVAWAMAESIESRPVADALEMAVARRCPGAGRLLGRMLTERIAAADSPQEGTHDRR